MVAVLLCVSTAWVRQRQLPVADGAERVAASTDSAPTSAPTPQGEWELSTDQEFSTPAALGQFATVYPGWASYDGFRDTSKIGLYDSSRVVSVQDGILTERLSTQARQPLVVSITPVPHVQTYGRYEVRFRADSVPGYKLAWLLWPADDDARKGEIDFPEVWLGTKAGIQGFSHPTDGGREHNVWALTTNESADAWHTAVIEWRPHSLTFILDGVSHTSIEPRGIPHVPMYWSLQTETSRRPPSSATGVVQIDYVREWRYTGGETAGDAAAG